MDEQIARAGEATLTFGRFVWQDLKHTARVFLKTFGASLGALSVVVFVVCVTGAGTLGRSPAFTLAVWLVGSVYYAFFPALVLASVVATWRHFGWTTLLPPLAIPALAALTFTLARSPLASQAHALGQALLSAGLRYNWPATHAVGRLAHAGPPALPFILLGVLYDAAYVLADGGVVWALVSLCALIAALAVASCALAFALTAPPMAWVFITRARRRWSAWKSAPGG